MLRPLFITRIAMFGFTLWLLGFLTVEACTHSSDVRGEPSFGSPLDVAAFAVIPAVFLWMSWRLWRAGVALTESKSRSEVSSVTEPFRARMSST